MALVKPKKKPTPMVSAWGGLSRSYVRPTSKAPTAPRSTPAAPTQPPKPVAPTLAPVPKPIATGPPPPSLQTTADRNAAKYDYSTYQGGVNDQLRSLGAQFGGAPQVQQFGYDANGDSSQGLEIQANAPGSTMEVLMRNLGLQKQNIDDTNLGDNTFFSSRRLGQLGSADQGYTGDVAAAQREYESAVNNLITGLMGARGTRDTNLSQADINDWQAAQQAPPEAQQPVDQPTAPSQQPGYVDAGGTFHSTILNPGTTSLINQWLAQTRKKK
jgi:hypothetical protein